MKKLTALLLLALMAVSLVAAQGKLVIRLGHIRDTNHPSHMAALKFKELVEAGSQGRIEVKVFPNSQLGDPKQMFVLMQTGDLEMVYGGINTFAWIKGGEPYEITATPFLFKDYDHMRRSMQADFFKPIQEKAEKSTGIKIVNINGDTAPRGLSTRDRPVVKAEDFKGLKVRTAASPTVLRAMQALGALPQQIAFSELYMAADKWNKLSAADKDLILKATEIAGNLETALTQKQLTDVYDFLKTKMTVLEADLPSIQAKLQGVYDDYEGSKWPAGLLAKIKSIQNN